jgi:hypothetical protein
MWFIEIERTFRRRFRIDPVRRLTGSYPASTARLADHFACRKFGIAGALNIAHYFGLVRLSWASGRRSARGRILCLGLLQDGDVVVCRNIGNGAEMLAVSRTRSSFIMFEVFNVGFPSFRLLDCYRGLQRRSGETDLQKLCFGIWSRKECMELSSWRTPSDASE